MSHGHARLGVNTPQSVHYAQGRFGRMFPSLPPFADETEKVKDALRALGAKGGPMDPGDDLSDPITLITDPAKSADNPDNPNLVAGFTFLGQFLDHDMTFDPTSSLRRQQDPESIRNFRTPALDLDNVYGSGPNASPHLYDAAAPGKLLVEEIPGSDAVCIGGHNRWDVPRNSQNVALLGDPRNDENLIVSQLQLAFLRFHNRVLDDVTDEFGSGYTRDEIFREAQRRVRWHYQWIVLHEFLPKTVGKSLVRAILDDGPKHYKWRNDPFIPVEFSVGAYRFGHSQVRPSYRANFGTSATDAAQQFFALFSDHSLTAAADPGDLRGGCRAPRRFIDWQTFFDFGDGRVRRNKRIDTKLSSILFKLLGQPADQSDSLATRNLIRGLTMKVPSGQRVARAMGEDVLPPSDLDDLKPFHLERRTPLWFYVLREADVLEDGQRLGPVGGRIVAEVIIGLINGDRDSFLRQDRRWRPTYGENDEFTTVDLLKAAGVVVAL